MQTLSLVLGPRLVTDIDMKEVEGSEHTVL